MATSSRILLSGDKTIGRLIKWLRALGLDVPLLEGPSPGRLFLTRKRSLAGKKNVFLITADRLDDQLKEIFLRLPDLKREIRPFSRCLRCNESLRPVAREEVFGRVPDYIFETQKDFSLCPRCQRIYWLGSHRQRMEERLRPYLF
ncbi:Mut7-C RNAse domain-containing protein [Thermosulfuriphilus sp.]